MAADMTATASPPAPVARPRRRRTARWVALGLGIVLVAFVVVLATRPPAATRVGRSPLVGKPAPAVAAETIDGEPFQLTSQQGRWVLVNFFATWCVPCRVEHPELIRFQQRHAALGDATVVGVVYGDSVDAVRAFRREEGGDWPMLVDPDGKIALEFGVSGVPESFLIDPGGTVVAKLVGGVRTEDLERLLRQARGAAR